MRLFLGHGVGIRGLTVGVGLAVGLSGCAASDLGGGPFAGGLSLSDVSEMMSQPRAIPKLIKQGEEALKAKDLPRAQRLFAAALKLDVTNPDLQYLNGLTYHLIGVSSDRTKLELAEQGLKLALKFDPGHLAARYQLGLLYLDQRRYGLAEGYFASVALQRPTDTTLLYNLAAAAYYAHDPRMAAAALRQLCRVSPAAQADPDVLRAQAVVEAALNDNQAAMGYLKTFRSKFADAPEAGILESRLLSWQGFYAHDAKLLPAQFNKQPDDPYGDPPAPAYGAAPDASGAAGGVAPGGAAAAVTPTALQPENGAQANADNMVVVDVVLIGTQEDVRDSRGINLLNGLQLQFGNPTSGAYGLSWGRNNVNDKLDGGLDENTRTITSQIGIPAVTYSLNIANTAESQNDILAKPSLVAQSGKTSEFFSGTEILAAAVSGGQGDSVSVQKEVGVKLAVTPEVLDDKFLRLHVVAERTFLTDPASSVLFDFRLDTTKTNINSTVTMRFGETLILGGLSERETSHGDDGVPGLKDIPGLNYLFSVRSKRHFERSILILLTPRRAEYTRQSEEGRKKAEERLSSLERDVERLENRHNDWFTPRPTFDQIIDNLKRQEFFEEFRSGDFRLKAWNEDPRNLAHIARIQDRLARN